MRWMNWLFCGWCHGRRTRGELNTYRGHTLVCNACIHSYKVSREDYGPLKKKGER